METFDHARFIRSMRSELASRCDRSRLAGFLDRVKKRVGGEALPLEEDEDALRFLSRVGAVRARHGTPAASERIDRFIEDCARVSGEEPGTVSLLIKFFCSGAYGLLASGICADRPECAQCSLAGQCSYASSQVAEGEAAEERLLRDGKDALGKAELIAVLLSSGKRSHASAKKKAEAVLSACGTLRRLADMKAAELSDRWGVGEVQAARIAAAFALAKKLAAEQRPAGKQFTSGEDFYEYYNLELRDEKRERFIVSLLDRKHRLISDETVSMGSLTRSIVHPREVFRRAIGEAAAAIAVVHNHPSGDPTPSRDDIEATLRLEQVGKLVGINLLDHIVIGEGKFVSFVEEGWL